MWFFYGSESTTASAPTTPATSTSVAQSSLSLSSASDSSTMSETLKKNGWQLLPYEEGKNSIPSNAIGPLLETNADSGKECEYMTWDMT